MIYTPTPNPPPRTVVKKPTQTPFRGIGIEVRSRFAPWASKRSGDLRSEIGQHGQTVVLRFSSKHQQKKLTTTKRHPTSGVVRTALTTEHEREIAQFVKNMCTSLDLRAERNALSCELGRLWVIFTLTRLQ